MSEPTKEISNPVKEEVKSAFKRSGRSSWIRVCSIQITLSYWKFLEYLKANGCNPPLYIKHQPEEGRKKEHIHLMMHPFDYPIRFGIFKVCPGLALLKLAKMKNGKPIYKPIKKEGNGTLS